MTIVASPENSTRSGDTTSALVLAMSALLECLRLGEHLIHAADVEERLLGHVVEVALEDRVEALDGLLEGNCLTVVAGVHLGDEERLRQEALDLASDV